MTSVPDPSPGGWLVLGLLMDPPARSGYDLQALAARSVAHFWPITKAHVYAELPRLEALGYVRGSAVRQSGVPDKRVYTPTPQGKAAFSRWLAEVDLGEPKLRHPLLVKVFFGAALPPAVLAAELDRHAAELSALRATYTTLLEQSAGGRRSRAATMRALTLRHGVRRIAADLAWLADVREAIGQ